MMSRTWNRVSTIETLPTSVADLKHKLNSMWISTLLGSYSCTVICYSDHYMKLEKANHQWFTLVVLIIMLSLMTAETYVSACNMSVLI